MKKKMRFGELRETTRARTIVFVLTIEAIQLPKATEELTKRRSIKINVK